MKSAWCASPPRATFSSTAIADNRLTGSFILIDRETNSTAAAGMILSRARNAAENAADRLARLIRRFVPAGALLNLPADDGAAIEELRQRLEGVWDE